VKRKRYPEEQIIGILKEAEAGVPLADLCRLHGMASASFYAWRKKYGGMEVSDAKRLRELEDENRRLKKLVAEQRLGQAGRGGRLPKRRLTRPRFWLSHRRLPFPAGFPGGNSALGFSLKKGRNTCATRCLQRGQWPR